mgnify:FL=1
MALERWKSAARRLKREVRALLLACRDPRVPWVARVLAVLVVAYALSPIDLIPDFIPILGHVDDLVLIPLGVALVIRLIPPEILAECRENARRAAPPGTRAARLAALAIGLLWGSVLCLTIHWIAGIVLS